MNKIDQVIDSIINGQYSQAKRQIKALTYDQRVELLGELAPPCFTNSQFDWACNIIVKRDFE